MTESIFYTGTDINWDFGLLSLVPEDKRKELLNCLRDGDEEKFGVAMIEQEIKPPITLWNIKPTLSGGKVFYEVQQVVDFGLFVGRMMKVIDYFEQKEKAIEFVKNQNEGKFENGEIRYWGHWVKND